MKLLFENWRKFLIKEQSELWGHHITPEQKVFISKTPYTEFRNVQQKKPPHPMVKPQGLWYGCGDAWVEWVRSESPEWLEASNYLYEVKTDGKVLKISNDEEFEELEAEFGIQSPFGRLIDWELIQKEGYGGIEICPYNMQRRMKSDWYYGWDVASGCIWDSSSIQDVVLLAEKEGSYETAA